MLQKLFYLHFIAGFALAQNDKLPPDQLAQLVQKFYTFYSQYPQQKIYVQTDRPYYFGGDDLYGKIYLINETYGAAPDSIRSKKIYVELINEKNIIVQKAVVNGLHSALNFSFHLPDSAGGGTYLLRAYTSWMIHYNDKNIFSTFLKIRADNPGKMARPPEATDAIDVQFLPEGGSLVHDMDNNVAFKAINKWGRSIDVEGFVQDNNKDIVCRFKSQHLGMGQFSFTPWIGQSYTVFITSGGKEYSYPLAPAPTYAYQVSVVKSNSESLTARVALGDSLYQKNKTTYLIATARGAVYFTSKGRGLYRVEIPLKAAPEGITQLTLFDDQMHPVSERLIYVSHPQELVHISADKSAYKKRGKVNLQIKAADEKGKPLQGFYALSVTDDHIVTQDENAATIKTQLLLSPYLQGYLEAPGSYFKKDDSTAKQNLDLVMLTHGWSRFTWQNIVDGNVATQPYEKDSSLAISGILATKKKEPLRNYSISLFSKTDDAFVGTTTTNEKGAFSFPGIDFTDSTSFFMQLKNPKGVNEDGVVLLDPVRFPLTNIDRPFTPREAPGEIAGNIKYHTPSIPDSLLYGAMKEVVVTSTKRPADYDEKRRVSQMSYIIPRKTIEEFNHWSVMDLMYLVPGATFVNGHVTFFGPSNFGDKDHPQSDPLVVVDGIAMPQNSPVSGAVDLHDVDFVEVLRGAEAAMYGVRGANGVILVNTKQGKDAPVYFTQHGINALQVPGYHVAKEFYAPKYETDESRLSKTKDERATIYWNGQVTTDVKGNASVSFYTADTPTTYTVTLEGITQNGAYIHQTFPINRTKF